MEHRNQNTGRWVVLAERYAFLASVVTVMIGAFVLASWWLMVDESQSISPPVVGRMNPLAAIGFGAAGIALLRTLVSRTHQHATGNTTAYISIVIVLVIGLATLISYLFGSNTGLDQLLFASTLHGNRIAPNTGVNFLIVGYVLSILLRKKNLTRGDQLIILLAHFIALLTIIGHFYSSLPLTRVSDTYTPMPLSTAITFAILCSGMLCTKPNEGIMEIITGNDLGGTTARRLLPTALIIPIVLGWLVLAGGRAHFYNATFGISLLTITSIVIFSILIWRNAITISRADAERRRHEQDLQDKNRELASLNEQIIREIQNTRRFQQAVEASTDAISIALPDLTYLYVNPAWERLSGYTAADVLSGVEHKQMTFRMSEKTDKKLLETMLARAASGGSFHSEDMVYRRKNGSEYQAEVSLYPVLHEDNIVFYVILHTDITQRKRVEAAQSSFVSLASHQLRTPITALRLALDTLERGHVGPLSDAQKEITQRAREYAVHMAETINMLLAVARLEAGTLHIEPERVSLAHLLNDLQSEYKIVQEQKQQKVSIDCQAHITLTTDATMLKEILANLLSNAINYTPPQGTITIAVMQDNGSVSIRVSDTGYGIPSYAQKKIFQKFFRADNVIKQKADGTGLGLYLVHALVRLLGGTISYTSQENAGTTFSLSFPLTPSPHDSHK